MKIPDLENGAVLEAPVVCLFVFLCPSSELELPQCVFVCVITSFILEVILVCFEGLLLLLLWLLAVGGCLCCILMYIVSCFVVLGGRVVCSLSCPVGEFIMHGVSSFLFLISHQMRTCKSLETQILLTAYSSITLVFCTARHVRIISSAVKR